jgi:hypothetical protein
MSRQKLRNAIAAESARLILRGKETDYAAARKRAARWLSRRKVNAQDMPTAAEIHSELYALSGLFSDEHQVASLWAMREAALELMQLLEEYQPHVSGCAVSGPVLAGAEITLVVSAGSAGNVVDALKCGGHRTRVVTIADGKDGDKADPTVIHLNHCFPCAITVHADQPPGDGVNLSQHPNGSLDQAGLQRLVDERNALAPVSADNDEPEPAISSENGYHPDTFACLQMLLQRLSQVQLDPDRHPEGDALYHSLQTYTLGLHERPYDEEFLLACLLHDAGLVIDRRNPVRGLLDLLGSLLTERTQFLIEHLAVGSEFLKTGQISRSFRRSEHFDDIVLLARCDRDARVPGEQVCELEEALDYIRNLDTAWDDS